MLTEENVRKQLLLVIARDRILQQDDPIEERSQSIDISSRVYEIKALCGLLRRGGRRERWNHVSLRCADGNRQWSAVLLHAWWMHDPSHTPRRDEYFAKRTDNDVLWSQGTVDYTA